jgi:hypothetical protein
VESADGPRLLPDDGRVRREDPVQEVEPSGIDGLAAIPIVGPVAAVTMGDRGMSNVYGMFERFARAGNTWSLGMDLLSSLVNYVDPTGAQRDFDLNSRILVYAQYANVRDTIRNLIQQKGKATYESFGRPMINALGGGGVIQYTQILNKALGLNNSEAAVTSRTRSMSHPCWYLRRYAKGLR